MECWKLLDDDSLVHVLNSLNEYNLNPEFDSEYWHNIILKLAPKKGDLRLLKNHRPIALLKTFNKILAAMIAARVDKHQELMGLATQAGFKSDFVCPDATAPLQTALQDLADSTDFPAI